MVSSWRSPRRAEGNPVQTSISSFAVRRSAEPGSASASGFWDGERNTSVFFDHGTNERYKMLKELSNQLQDQKAQAIRGRGAAAADKVRLADTVQMLIEIEREDSDIEVVSHETTHQLAATRAASAARANTALGPRGIGDVF